MYENLNPFRNGNGFEANNGNDSTLNDLLKSSISIKTNKKAFLRIYSLSQLINQEIIRLEERNLAKRAL